MNVITQTDTKKKLEAANTKLKASQAEAEKLKVDASTLQDKAEAAQLALAAAEQQQIIDQTAADDAILVEASKETEVDTDTKVKLAAANTKLKASTAEAEKLKVNATKLQDKAKAAQIALAAAEKQQVVDKTAADAVLMETANTKMTASQAEAEKLKVDATTLQDKAKAVQLALAAAEQQQIIDQTAADDAILVEASKETEVDTDTKVKLAAANTKLKASTAEAEKLKVNATKLQDKAKAAQIALAAAEKQQVVDKKSTFAIRNSVFSAAAPQINSKHHNIKGATFLSGEEAIVNKINASPKLSARALFHQVQLLQEVFCSTSGVSSFHGDVDVQQFEELCASKLHTNFGRAESLRLFRHLIGSSVNTNPTDLRVPGIDLVEYFLRGIRIGRGAPRETFADRSSLHRHIAAILSRLDQYAYTTVQNEEQTAKSHTVLFAGNVVVTPTQHGGGGSGADNDNAKQFFVAVVPQSGLQLYQSEEEYISWTKRENTLGDSDDDGDDDDASALQSFAPLIYPEVSIAGKTMKATSGEKDQDSLSLSVVEIDTRGSVQLVRTEELLMQWFVSEDGSDEQERVGRIHSPPDGLHIGLSNVQERQQFINAISFMDAARQYERQCRKDLVKPLEAWIQALYNGDASCLEVARYGGGAAQASSSSSTTSSSSVDPLAIVAVRVSLSCLSRAQRISANHLTTTSSRLNLRTIRIRGILVNDDHVLALRDIFDACNSTDHRNHQDHQEKEKDEEENKDNIFYEVDFRGCFFTRDGQHGRVLTSPSLVNLLSILRMSLGLWLKKLSLSRCELDGEAAVHAFETVLRGGDEDTNDESDDPRFSLDALDLSGNALPGDAVVRILRSFGERKIRGLDLSGNILESHVDVVSALWRQKPSLRFLSLAHCAVSDGVLAAVVSGLVSTGSGSVLEEIDLRGNLIEGQVVTILSNALSSDRNTLSVVHAGEGVVDARGFRVHNSDPRHRLLDMKELQHNLTHRRFGRPTYRLATLTLARDPTSISSGNSLPCAASLIVSGLRGCFSPSLYASELSSALDVSSRHFQVRLRDAEKNMCGSFSSEEGRLAVQVEVSGVPSLKLGDVDANRTVVSRLVDFVSTSASEVVRLVRHFLLLLLRYTILHFELYRY